MHECEARDWLRRGYSTPDRIEELTELIAKRRGAGAAAELVAEMRRQWQHRNEWMGGNRG
ncbi:hypothetical protein BVH03_25125 [Pseudomonas sp. PA15(2017)]|nr:hypothetical protein BVH03_25125 [Pseudomonas sp. PA15(2017)]